MRRARRDLAWAACESSLFTALLCGTAASRSSTLRLLAALRVDACKCARAPEDARLTQALRVS